jgi:uncharacterized repeat protein (TIGR03803 family)
MKSKRITAHPVARPAHSPRPAKRLAAWRACALTLVALLGLPVSAGQLTQAQTFTVLYSFAGYPTDGEGPDAGLLMDASGNLYGTTTFGGNVNLTQCGNSGYIGCGTVFKLDTKGTETVLHNFTGAHGDGTSPIANLIIDASGNLYGTTLAGGIGCVGETFEGCGVVFKLSNGKETLLHRFTGGTDGKWPWAGVIADARGALYGTTYLGGKFNDGAVFKLAGKTETVLHSFTGGKGGGLPAAGLLLDTKGNLFGTATYGGDINCDYPYPCGVVFKLAGKKETVLHTFKGSPDGDTPVAGLVMDAEGNLYGTTRWGGESYNAGTVFKLSSSGKESVLHRFRVDYQVQHDGVYPGTAVVRDAQGNLYGTTEEGGPNGAGVVYEITAGGKERILHTFCSGDCSDGAYPNGLIIDAKGNLYGTAFAGGVNRNGTIFMITP